MSTAWSTVISVFSLFFILNWSLHLALRGKSLSEITKGPQCRVYYLRFCFLKKTLRQPRNHNTIAVSNEAAMAPPLLCLTSGSNLAAKTNNEQLGSSLALDRIIWIYDKSTFLSITLYSCKIIFVFYKGYEIS